MKKKNARVRKGQFGQPPNPTGMLDERQMQIYQQALRLAQTDTSAKLDRDLLAQALYEGTPHLQNLAEKMARHYGKAEAIPFYGMTSQTIRDFWLSIADQIIEHSKHYEPNEGSSAAWSEHGIGTPKVLPNATPESYYEPIQCPNCRVDRSIDSKGYVEKCPNCGDDEWNIFEPTPDVP